MEAAMVVEQQHHVVVDGGSATAEEESGIGGLPLRRKCGFEPEPVPAPKIPRLEEEEKETIIDPHHHDNDRTGACRKKEGIQSTKSGSHIITFRNGVQMDVAFLAAHFAESDEERKKRLAPRVEPSQERLALWEAQNKNRSELAVKLYNADLKPGEGLELELVEPLVSTPFCLANRWIHMNFIAKPKNGSDDGKRRYFAELRQIGLDKCLLTVCCPVEPKGSGEDDEATE